MKRLPAALALLLVASSASAENPMARFAGSARVTCASGGVGFAAALSEDMPGTGWENRWRVLLSIEAPASCLRSLEVRDVWIRTSATSRGSYTIDIPTWGLIEIVPGDPTLRETLRRAAPGSESRFKLRIVLSVVGDALELLIEEPH